MHSALNIEVNTKQQGISWNHRNSEGKLFPLRNQSSESNQLKTLCLVFLTLGRRASQDDCIRTLPLQRIHRGNENPRISEQEEPIHGKIPRDRN